MRLTLGFDVNRQRITPDDLKWMRRFQRELVSTVASVAFCDFAVKHDAALADYLALGEGTEGSRTFQPSEHLKAFYRPDRPPWAARQPLEPIETARDICCVAHWDEWMFARWAVKVHIMLLQAQARTESVHGGDVTVVTRMALPAGVNERCHATLTRIIDRCWFKASEPGFDVFDPQDPMRQRVRDALVLGFTAGLIRDGIEKSVSFEVSRLDPVILDTGMVVQLSHADCELDNDVRQSDAEVGIERW